MTAGFVLELDTDGTIGWHAFLDGYVQAYGIAVDSSQNLYVAGQLANNLTVWKLQYLPPAALNVVWHTSLNTPGNGRPAAIALDGIGHVYVAGTGACFNGPNGEPTRGQGSRCNGYWPDMFALKMDTAGNYLWHASYHPEGGGQDAAGMALDGTGTILVTGSTDGVMPAAYPPIHSSPSGIYLVAIDSDGGYLWNTEYGGRARSIAIGPNHATYVAGYSYSNWLADNNSYPLLSYQGNIAVFSLKLGTGAATTTTAAPASIRYSPIAQTINLSATVASNSSPVPDGEVAFGLLGTNVRGPVTAGSASAAFTVPAATAPGSYPIVAVYRPASSYASSTSTSAQLTIGKATPVVAWANPADITLGTALGPLQLNATASVPGSFIYTPPSGTILAVGDSQKLSVAFTPTDSTDYNAASGTVYINVKPSTTPPAPPQLTITKTLSRDTAANHVVVSLRIANTGGSAAQNVQLTVGKLISAAGTPLPQSLGSIVPGASVNATVNFPGTVGPAGTAAVLTLGGTYTGGSFNSGSKVVLP